jgi:exopolyphosphatase/guanosine-5'-triphosphate,3'-diphosphate pyrophosphatase
MAREVYGALDLGTNNCRLLIARPAPDGFRVVDAFSRIVRLGEGVLASGRLSEQAMARTLLALKICADKMAQRGVTRVRAVATEACRRARNCGLFLDRVKRDTGIALEIISSSEEANLALYGCAPLLDGRIRHAIVFDIGGGSTEVSWLGVPRGFAGRGRRALRLHLLGYHSLPFGVVTLAERYGGHVITTRTYQAMVEEVGRALAPFEARHQLRALVAGGRVQMLGTSGTVTTLAGVHQCLARYDRARIDGCYLSFDTVREVTGRIAAMSYDERAANPCIGHQRADLVVAGCAILETLCRTWPVGRLRVADRGLREGILVTLMARARPARPASGRPASQARAELGERGA